MSLSTHPDIMHNADYSGLVTIHNDNFFSAFKLLDNKNYVKANAKESYYSVLEKVFELSKDLLIIVDYRGSIKSYFNNSLQQIIHLCPEIIGKNIEEIFPHSFRRKIRHSIKSVINNNSIKTLNVSFSKDASNHIYEIKIIPSLEKVLLFYLQEITTRIINEENLKKSDELLKSIWNNSFDGMRLTDRSGKVVAVNKAFCLMMGINAEVIIGRHYSDIYSNNNNKTKVKVFNKVWKGNVSKYSEYELQTKTGKNLNVNIMNTLVADVFSPEDNRSKNEFLLLSVFRDLTEKIKNESKLRDAERLSTFGKMSAYLAHQLKTPLATIKMNLELLEKSNSIPPEKFRSYKIIGNEIKRLNKLLQNTFLFLKRSDNIEIKIELFELINSIKSFFEPILQEKDIMMINDVEHIIISGDYQKIRMAFMILIENSIEAISGKGEIKISGLNENHPSMHSIIVEDSGAGIADCSSLFETFYTTKSGGTGLGLTIVKHLLAEVGGGVNLISSKKGKTIFKIMLPAGKKINGKNISN